MALTFFEPYSRFTDHVSFDNFAGGEQTDKNTISFTLNVKHTGYKFRRRSRTFMVGLDENTYSDIALQWTLEELVDDGDEIICLRVIDSNAKIMTDRSLERKYYQQEARNLMESIQSRNDEDRAISLVLEFAVGKVAHTFQRMVRFFNVWFFSVTNEEQIQIYEPCMLIVGTRGRSLGGIQGLVTNRNSFSKWCLQYSPIPVVVVRPTEKRLRKKLKRDVDPTRQDYARILKESGIEYHETMNHSTDDHTLEASNDPRAEAHAVADALNLPAHFRPEKIENQRHRSPRKSDSNKSEKIIINPARVSTPELVLSPKSENLDSPTVSGDEDSEDDADSGEFEAIPGDLLLQNGDISEEEKKQRLHEMEVGEAAALRKLSIGSLDSTDSRGLPAVAEDGEEKAETENGTTNGEGKEGSSD